MKNVITLITFLLLIAFALTGTIQAQDATYDTDRMARDLRIMERVYTDLQNQAMGGNRTTSARTVSGAYFPGYGVVFNVSESFVNIVTGFKIGSTDAVAESLFIRRGVLYPPTVSNPDSNSKAQQEQKRSNLVTTRYEVTGFEHNTSDSTGIQMHKMNEQIIRDFFGNYVDAIGQLKDSDRISVQVSFRGGNALSYSVLGPNNRLQTMQFNPLRAEVLMSDVRAFRSGKMKADDFNKKIVFSELDPSSSDHKELQIMRGIFDSMLKTLKNSAVSPTRDVQAVMMTNFGAMFTIDVRLSHRQMGIEMLGGTSPNNILSVEIDDEQNQSILILRDSTRITVPMFQVVRHPRIEKSTQSGQITLPEGVVTVGNLPTEGVRARVVDEDVLTFEESMSQLINELSNVLVDYGRTLRTMKPTDKILLIVNNHSLLSGPSNRIELQVDVQTLRDYDRGAITREKALSLVGRRDF